MESSPLVSIAAINFNNSKYVIETLESIKNQSYANIELLIIDDCSTDGSVAMIKEWLKSYHKPFQLLMHEKNMGVCFGCNNALNNARGKYFSLIATDDIMMPDKIKIQVEALEWTSEDVCCVYSDAFLIKEDGSPRYGWFIQRYRDFPELPSGNLYEELIIGGNFIPGMTVLCKTDCLRKVGGFDEALAYEDYDMWLRLSKNYKFLFSSYNSAKYRIRNDSLTSTLKNLDYINIKIYSKHIDFHPIAINRLEYIAKCAFYNRDKKTLKELLPLKDKIPAVHTAIFYSRFNLPNALLYRVKFNSIKDLRI